ncbi:pre-mRNA splicing factor [Suhomyces tanzawaensis NRRL Y-17324]|uniref:Pre-mRNA splicing factor n=1 Tax=Suhomyces tanzawaensis NRRL Y-17324 TaxID=984487 RepID=A0A1E4SCS1_9ASCO|nr:pre-mRNA splicing factor [Suhomyces tanzawaensis NRRL Y-17324]ODV77295.1 pre-mRNA splicing factor [Suhomyces tanzawaensis NRRL Y-17324]
MTRLVLPTFLQGQVTLEPPFSSLKQKIVQDETNIHHWDALFKAFQDKVDEDYDPKHPEKITDELKKSIHATFETLLLRFPYLSEHWRLWLVLEYKINGVESSIKVLEDSVQNHPFSLELWVDYISALISQYESAKSREKLQLIRAQYSRAIDLIGHQFSSHPLWDKVLDFEASIDPSSSEILHVYKQVTQIPLYQYAQYYKQFVEINKSFQVAELLDQDQLEHYVAKFGKTSLKELSLIEKHQIIDDYTYATFLKTQQAVNIKWAFESSITIHNFDLKTEKDTLASELTSWKTYLDHEIKQYELESNGAATIKPIISLFERCLIPHCLNSSIWLKYLAFLNKVTPEESKLEAMKPVYLRAITKFIPLNENFIRFNYARFLVSRNKFDEANDFLVDFIKFCSGSGSNATCYMKQPYIESVRSILQLWEKHLSNDSFTSLCIQIIEEYFTSRNEKKRVLDSQSEEEDIATKSFKTKLLQLINNEGVCLVVKFYLEHTGYSEDNVPKLREFYNKYSQEIAFKTSVFFWRYFMEFEGISQRDFANFETVFYYVRTQTQLPKLVIDSFVDLAYDIVCANFSEIFPSNSNLDTLLISKGSETSNSLLENQSARRTLANQNHSIKRGDDLRSSKQNISPVNKEEELLKITHKHIGSPGIFIESTPDITNKIMNEGDMIDLTDPRLTVPPYPSFKNVEKASLPIHYPNDN